MHQIWTEELAPVVVPGPEGPAQLVGTVVVTGVDGLALHGELRLSGELCAATTPPVSAAVERLLAMGVADLRFDLHQLRLCTSAGIDLWVDAATRVLSSGGDVRLDGASGVVRRALDAVGVTDSAQVQPRRD